MSEAPRHQPPINPANRAAPGVAYDAENPGLKPMGRIEELAIAALAKIVPAAKSGRVAEHMVASADEIESQLEPIKSIPATARKRDSSEKVHKKPTVAGDGIKPTRSTRKERWETYKAQRTRIQQNSKKLIRLRTVSHDNHTNPGAASRTRRLWAEDRRDPSSRGSTPAQEARFRADLEAAGLQDVIARLDAVHAEDDEFKDALTELSTDYDRRVETAKSAGMPLYEVDRTELHNFLERDIARSYHSEAPTDETTPAAPKRIEDELKRISDLRKIGDNKAADAVEQARAHRIANSGYSPKKIKAEEATRRRHERLGREIDETEKAFDRMEQGTDRTSNRMKRKIRRRVAFADALMKKSK